MGVGEEGNRARAGAGVGEGVGEVPGGGIRGEKLEDEVGREKEMWLGMDGDGDRGRNDGSACSGSGNGNGSNVCGGVGVTGTRGGGDGGST